MTITELTSHPVEIRLDGVFDVSAAQAILCAIEPVPDQREVRIDLTRVSELHDFGFAVLAHGLALRRDQVTIRGLRERQLRLLRYLGLAQMIEPEGRSEGVWA